MQVEIVHIEQPPGGEAAVEVRSDLGRFPARWHGPPPAVGARVDVELSLDHRFTWGVDAVAVDEQPHAITPAAGDGVVFLASVDQLDDGGFVGLRLGRSVLMAEADGEPPPVGSTVRLEAPAVTLFDTGT
ncbi:MAG TPA: hypothetical protein VHE35_30165 [Kofleriaceae bacterium]|nr:hypothetical protein [Kofleriaceae bacterium]